VRPERRSGARSLSASHQADGKALQPSVQHEVRTPHRHDGARHTPHIAPSTVFAGLTAGMSLRRPTAGRRSTRGIAIQVSVRGNASSAGRPSGPPRHRPHAELPEEDGMASAPPANSAPNTVTATRPAESPSRPGRRWRRPRTEATPPRTGARTSGPRRPANPAPVANRTGTTASAAPGSRNGALRCGWASRTVPRCGIAAMAASTTPAPSRRIE
jgi:hypothetical protein